MCLDAPRQLIFMPCKHMVCCKGCMHRVDECPQCGGQIMSTIEAPTFEAAREEALHALQGEPGRHLDVPAVPTAPLHASSKVQPFPV